MDKLLPMCYHFDNALRQITVAQWFVAMIANSSAIYSAMWLVFFLFVVLVNFFGGGVPCAVCRGGCAYVSRHQVTEAQGHSYAVPHPLTAGRGQGRQWDPHLAWARGAGYSPVCTPLYIFPKRPCPIPVSLLPCVPPALSCLFIPFWNISSSSCPCSVLDHSAFIFIFRRVKSGARILKLLGPLFSTLFWKVYIKIFLPKGYNLLRNIKSTS